MVVGLHFNYHQASSKCLNYVCGESPVDDGREIVFIKV